MLLCFWFCWKQQLFIISMYKRKYNPFMLTTSVVLSIVMPNQIHGHPQVFLIRWQIWFSWCMVGLLPSLLLVTLADIIQLTHYTNKRDSVYRTNQSECVVFKTWYLQDLGWPGGTQSYETSDGPGWQIAQREIKRMCLCMNIYWGWGVVP